MRSRQVHRTRKSPHKDRNCSQLKEGPLSTGVKRDAQQASASGPKTNRQILRSAWFSKHTTRPLVHSSARLKHSNFSNTDRMRKRNGPTAVHMKPFSTSVFNNSDRDVSSSFRATQILRQGPVHPTLWNTSVFKDRLTHAQQIRIGVVFTHAFSALRNASENVRPHSNIRSVARRKIQDVEFTFTHFSNLRLVILRLFHTFSSLRVSH